MAGHRLCEARVVPPSLDNLARPLIAEWIEREAQPAEIADALERELLDALSREPAVCVGDATRGAAAIVQGNSAWTLGVVGDARAQTIAELARACAAAGAARLCSAGPPRWYLRSGVRTDERAAWLDAGGSLRSTHFDLVVDAGALAVHARAQTPSVSRIESAEDLAQIQRWLREEFSTPWAIEVGAAFARRGAWGAREGREWVAVAAHSGHCAAAGTFGPLATRAAARGRGHGARVTIAALADAGQRGFSRVTVPWVDADVQRFYERIATVTARVERALLVLALR